MARKAKDIELISSTIQMLEIIYDKVSVSKRADRYIVGNTDGDWGVVDSDGNIIIPVKYSRITTSNDKVFRVYGKIRGTKTVMFDTFNIKDQAIFDYDGKQLIDFKPYSRTLAVGKYGILLGEVMYAKPNTSCYVGYNGKSIEFDNSNNIVNVYHSKHVSELMVLVHKNAIDYNMGYRPDIGIRADKGNLEIKPLKDCYDELHELDVETMIANGINYSHNEELTGLAKQYKNAKVYIGIINGKATLVDSSYFPVFRKTVERLEWKSINN